MLSNISQKASSSSALSSSILSPSGKERGVGKPIRFNTSIVSSTQISKWKKGEHMSADMEKKFRNITQIGDYSPQLVEWTGS
ncbi:hypothetical protein ACSLOB_29150, partial [Escherichia coli]